MRLKIGSLVLVAVVLAVSPALALPQIPGLLPGAIKENKDAEKFGEMFGKLEMKCSVCHIPGEDKKKPGHALNDFGDQMHKHFDDKAFKKAIEGKNNDDATKILKAGWDKSVEEKNADGKKYGDIIKEGNLPSKNEKKKAP